MSSRTQDYILGAFGHAGVVTDESPERLKADQLSGAENMVLPDGVVTERGGWAGTGEVDPLNDGDAYLLDSVLTAVNPDTGATELVVTGVRDDGALWAWGRATTGLEGQGGTLIDGPARARGVYGGEALICPEDGVTPIRRWSYLRRTELPSSSGTGTYAVADGSNQLVGTGSNFNPELVPGAYVGAVGNRSAVHRVVSVPTDTRAGLASKADWDVPSGAVNFNRSGVIGLKVLVTNIGLASHSAASTTVSGNGTSWAQAGSGFGAVAVGDYVLKVGDDIANALRVTSVVSDAVLNVGANTVGAWTDQPYVILRPACGREAVEHDNALWIAGVDWADDTVFTTPPAYELARVTNGRFGKTIQADEAMRMFEIPVPSPGRPGRILALRSTPWGLAVGKSDALYVITGEYPANQVRRVAETGVLDQRAMVAVDDVLIYGAREGIFAWQGGRPQDLSAGRRAEWVERARTMTRCVMGTVRNHLFISFEAATGAECWLYDLDRGVHLGNITSDDAAHTVVDPSTGIAITTGLESAVYMDSARIPDEEDRLLAVIPNPNRRQVQDVTTTIIGPGEDAEVPGTNIAPLEVWTGTNVAGDIARRARVVGAKVTYELRGASPGVLSLVTKVDGGGELAERTFPATGATPVTVRANPSSGGLGMSMRSMQVGLRRVGGTSVTHLSVHELGTSTRVRRARVA